MAYLPFLRANRALLSFGLLTALSTSFGQTFFFSLFLPHFQHAFHIGKAEFGWIYGAITLLSAVLLPLVAVRLDLDGVPRFSAATLAGLALSALLLALASNLWLFAAALLGLRFLGHGILSHISHTVMAREFGFSRGKALGIAGIGYPLGEGLLPILTTLLLLSFSWRTVWFLVASLLAIAILPLSLRLLSAHPPTAIDAASGPNSFDRTRLRRDPRFLLALPAVLVLPFVLTGMFLFQTAIAESNRWPLAWIASAFAAYAVTRAFSSLLAGGLIDRFSAARLLPFQALPLVAGLAVAVLGGPPWLAFLYLVLAGLTAGASGSITSAVWAELYGAANVGRVRSLVAAFTVFSTAASPALMGWLFQRGVPVSSMLAGAGVLTLAASAVSLPIGFARRFTPASPASPQTPGL